MTDDVIDDLKQFIAATVSQATAHLATKDDLEAVRSSLQASIDDLDLKMDTIADDISGTKLEAMPGRA